METIKIMTGFQEIRTELRKKRPGLAVKCKLRLFFTYQQGMLSVHDYEDMSESMLVAIEDKGKWKMYLDSTGYGSDLVHFVIMQSRGQNIAGWLNELYVRNGDI